MRVPQTPANFKKTGESAPRKVSGLRPIGEIIAESLPKWGKRAIQHHLNCESTATGEVAREAFDQANGIRLSMDLSWPEVFSGDEANDNGTLRDQGVA